jgi:hypothetical protein
MPITWTTTDKQSVENGIKCLVYSGSGYGKTTLCATAPNPLILSAESGLLPLRKFSIPVMVIHTLEDLMEAYRWVSTSTEARVFETVCLDSLSEIGEVVLAHLIKTKGQNDPRKAYGELLPQVTQMIRAFRDLPGKNVYFAAKMEPVRDDMSGKVMYMPSMPGQKLGPQLPYFFDEVFRLAIGKDEKGNLFRYLQTQPDMQYEAKDRSGALAAMEPPDLNHVFRKIKGG